MVRIKKPTKAEMQQDWNSKEPRELAHEIAHFMGGKWPERRERKVPLSLEGAPLLAEELFEVTQLNPTLLNEMSVKTRLLFLEVYLDDIQANQNPNPNPNPGPDPDRNPNHPNSKPNSDPIPNQDVYSEVMESLVANPKEKAVNRVTYNSLRKVGIGLRLGLGLG